MPGRPGEAACAYSDCPEEVEMVCHAVQDMLYADTPARPVRPSAPSRRPDARLKVRDEREAAPRTPVDVFVFA
ncbi:hypothetical protein [Limimaricola pyoseonensis]|nr:hypothetical protein [Limimaricola pyoseonensis]